MTRQSLSKIRTATKRLNPDDSGCTHIPAYYLIVLSGNNVGYLYPLVKEEILLGRDDAMDIQILDMGVSRKHALLSLDIENQTYQVKDLNSHNGTLVNGERIAQTQLLRQGDKIQVGMNTILRLGTEEEEETQYAKSMYHAMLVDTLTGAYNRRYFNERLATDLSFAHRHSVPVSLLFLDIDFFKAINDNFDHQCGDAILCQFTQRICELSRVEDVITRYGGEEFAIICQKTDEREAAALAERLRQGIEDTDFHYNDLTLNVTISIGVSAFEENDLGSIDAIFSAADAALLRAKELGRNMVVLASTLQPPGK